MRLLEFEGKRLLAETGLTVPAATLVTDHNEMASLTYPRMLKVQVLVGGRGKTGGVRIVRTTAEAVEAAQRLLSTSIKGCPVAALLAEEVVEIQQELYLACLIDKVTAIPLIIASACGGIDIEEIALKRPEKIHRFPVDPLIGLREYAIRAITKSLGLADWKALGAWLTGIIRLFERYDATLVEINPLAITPTGLVAVDAKIILDDAAAYRHQDLYAGLNAERRRLDRRPKTPSQALAEELGLNYVLLEGDVGVIADGAGTGMLTVDLIQDFGGRAGNFCEMGGQANADIIFKTLGAVLADKRLNVLVISLIGGLTRMDHMAEGITAYVKEKRPSIPLVVRMCGTKADIGLPILKDAGVDVFEDLDETVRMAVHLAEERRSNGHTDRP